MNFKVKSFIVALAAGLSVGPLTAADNNPGAGAPSTNASAQPGAAMDVLTMLNHVNQMEIEAGQLAQKNSQSPAVQQLGKDLERDHKAAQDKVKELADKQGIDLYQPVATGPEDQQKVEKMQASVQNLENLQGAAFDKAFLKSMTDGHKETIQSLKEAQSKAGSSEVKSLVSQLLPTLQKHERTATNLMKKQG